MSKKKLKLGKIKITKLNNLSKIIGGSNRQGDCGQTETETSKLVFGCEPPQDGGGGTNDD